MYIYIMVYTYEYKCIMLCIQYSSISNIHNLADASSIYNLFINLLFVFCEITKVILQTKYEIKCGH